MSIGLAVDASSVAVAAEGTLGGVVDGSIAFRVPAGQTITATREGRAIRVTGGAVGAYERVTFTSLEGRRHVMLGGKAYRGVLHAFAGPAGVTVVNELPLEAYLGGVVNAELGRRSAAERAAVEAQAIVARTYALKEKGKRAAAGFDLLASPADQVYGGIEAETPLGLEAVRGTDGLVLTYQGDLITTFFHSTCGSTTAAPEEALRFGRPLPYLRPVSDRRPGGYFCDISPRFRWTAEWDVETLSRILRRTVPAVLGVDGGALASVREVRVQHTGPSGRVVELRVATPDGEIPVFGPDIRQVLQTPEDRMLGSTLFELVSETRGGSLARLTAAGRGWGHGLGMCQWGAVGRARAGQDARTIVTTYFPGTTVTRWYP
jgi:stage II sporulation protein D